MALLRLIIVFWLLVLNPAFLGAQCTVNAGVNAAICSGQSVILGGAPTASGGSGSYSYDWSGDPTVQDIANPTVSPVTTTTYSVLVNDGAGCVSSASVTVTVTPTPIVNAGPDIDPCLNSPSVSLPNPGGQGIWSGALPGMLTAQGAFTPSTLGTYVLTLSITQNGCTGTDQINAQVRPLPVTNAGPDQTICQGQTVQLSASATSPNGIVTLYTWSGGAVSNSLSSSPTASPASTTTYNVTAVDIEGCSKPDQITVFVNPLPAVNAGGGLTLCQHGPPLTLSGQSPSGGTWSGLGVTPAGVFTPSASGSFVLTYSYTSPAGCTNSASRVVNVTNSGSLNAGADQEICLNAPPIQLNPVDAGGTWSGSPQVSSAGLFTPQTIGVHSLTYSKTVGACTITDVVSVTVHDLPVAHAGPDMDGCSGIPLTIQGSVTGGQSPYTYTWFKGGVQVGGSSVLALVPSTNDVYELEVRDLYNCAATDQMALNVWALPFVDAGPDEQFCNTPVAEPLHGFSPSGGTWSGPLVTSGGLFIPAGTGAFTVSYSYTDSHGCWNTDQKTVTILSAHSVNAGSDFSRCFDEGVFHLAANTNSPGTWSGPGVQDDITGEVDPASAGTGAHTYILSDGTGSCGAQDAVVVTIEGNPFVTAGPDESFCFGEGIVNLTGHLPMTGQWSGVHIVNPAQGTFDASSAAGNFVVAYTYTDSQSGCSSTAYKSVVVSPLPVASFQAVNQGCVNAGITFTNSSSGASQYEWDFGANGSISTQTNPVNQYSNSGVFSVELRAISSSGCEDVYTKSIEILSLPVAGMQVSQSQGCAPLAVTFSDQSQGSYLNYNWDFGNGTSTASNPLPITYIENGGELSSYTASLSVSNLCGTSQVSQVITVLPRPDAVFTTELLTTECSPVQVSFHNECTGDPDGYNWDFGNGSSSTDMNPVPVVYTTGGTPTDYDIRLKVYNGCGQDSVKKTITVQPNLVHADFEPATYSGCSPLAVVIDNQSTGATTYEYDIPGLPQVNQPDPVIDLTNPGSYVITLTATDGCGIDIIQKTIEVLPSPAALISVSTTETCEGSVVHLEAVTNGANQVEWEMGDGTILHGLAIDHSYDDDDDYDVTLTAEAPNLCVTEAMETISVRETPDVSFSVNSGQGEGCAPFNICFTNATSGADSYEWNFGNGLLSSSTDACAVLQNLTTDDITYEITLVAENQWQCSGTAIMPITVHPVPASSILMPSEGSCEFPVTITASYGGDSSDAVEWTINGSPSGQGGQADLLFDHVGPYVVGLTATNEHGCSSDVVKNFEVYPQPVAALDAVPTSGCEDLNVEFINQSVGAADFVWYFGNAGSSSQLNPDFTFSEAGSYDVELVAISSQGCTDTLTIPGMIEAYPTPVARFEPSSREVSLYTPEVSFLNESEGGTEYMWQFGGGGQSAEESPVHEFAKPGHWPVTLTVTNEHGCTHDHTEVIEVTNDLIIYVPNSFTPDGDGLNDVFLPRMPSTYLIREYELMIFDRWGTVVFRSEDPEEAWTGNVRGGDYFGQSTTYRYIIHLEGNENTETKTVEGLVTMLR